MKPRFPIENRSSKSTGRRGVALVVVLGMLVLVLVLVVAFLSSVSVELQSAKKYSSGADARTLADSAVSLVISQIQDATSGFARDGSGTPISTRPLAWASQPGMVRTYDTAGMLDTAYKLYSSSNMQVTGSFNPVAAQDTEVPPNWASLTALYTDLNKPVAVSGKKHYPIINPSAVGKDLSGGAPLEPGLPAIEGSFINTSAAAVQVSGSQLNPVPMPVQWLYVLKSGSIVSASAGGVVSAASSADPIVGRIAFWTDDESSKVNVNTASEGTFWDRPWATGGTAASYERKLANSMPVQNEFQRFPGHPAMTSLSVIFPEFAASTAAQEILYGMIPRVSAGGSTQGTALVTGTSTKIIPDNNRLFASVDEFFFSATNLVSGTRQTNPKGGGTFNVEDIERTRFFLTANSRAPEVNLFNKPRVTLWPLQANPDDVTKPTDSKFRNAKDRLIAFCSTVGTVPYYFQRFSVYTSPTQDPVPSSQSPTMDWDLIPRNQQIYAYLQSLTSSPIPGFGGSFSSKYSKTRDQILTEMFDLTRSMVNTFNTSEAPFYYYTPFNPAGMIKGQGQVVPLELPNGTKGFGRFPTVTEAALIVYQRTPLTISGTMPAGGTITTTSSGSTIVVRTFASGTVLNKWPLPDSPGDAVLRISGSYSLDHEEPEARDFGAVIILEPFNPTPGPPPWTANVRYAISGLGSLGLGFNSSGTLVNMVSAIDHSYNATATTGLEANLQKPPRAPKVLAGTDPNNPAAENYPFYGEFSQAGSTFNFSGGSISIDILQGSSRQLAASDVVQTIQMEFPAVAGLPLPLLGSKTVAGSGTSTVTTVNLYTANQNTLSSFDGRLSFIRRPENVGGGRWGIAEPYQHSPLPLVLGTTGTAALGDTVRSVEARRGGATKGDYRMISGLKTVPTSYFEGHGLKDTDDVTGNLYAGASIAGRVVHSLTLDNMQGDSDQSKSMGFYFGAGSGGDLRGKLVENANYNDPNRGGNDRNSTRPVAPRGLKKAVMANGALGDWDNGVGTTSDGPYVNFPDLGNSNFSDASSGLYYAKGGYINSDGMTESGASFSPNRQIASAVAFGSLPTGIDPTDPENAKPWQTLLFGRHPAAGTAHPGFGTPLLAPPYTSPPDHLLLDLFTMPIVEPYAISEPFSTAGKVNMNYQIVPFTYLTRSTGVRAVLKSTNIMVIPASQGASYKYSGNNPPDFRYTLEASEKTGTLRGFEKRFEKGDIFRSASEICDISLVPKRRVDNGAVVGNPTYDGMDSWWSSRGGLTGDNVRESPYGQLYPRLTTKSNTFTVHVLAQSISKVNGTPANQFVEGRDQISGEFRGSFLIERYLDPNADSLVPASGKLPDGAQPPDEKDAAAMIGPYKFRVVNSKRFAP